MPQWFETIKLGDVFHNDDLDLQEKTEEIVTRLKAASWRSFSADPGEFDRLVDELSKAGTLQEFNFTWEELYDLADLDRIWIETH
jgi:hypothetical protein